MPDQRGPCNMQLAPKTHVIRPSPMCAVSQCQGKLFTLQPGICIPRTRPNYFKMATGGTRWISIRVIDNPETLRPAVVPVIVENVKPMCWQRTWMSTSHRDNYDREGSVLKTNESIRGQVFDWSGRWLRWVTPLGRSKHSINKIRNSCNTRLFCECFGDYYSCLLGALGKNLV